MPSFFTNNFFEQNRKSLTQSVKDAELIILTANSKLQKNADDAYPFRQDSSFWYFTGVDVPDALLMIDLSAQKEYLILPYRDKHRDQWETNISLADVQKTSGITTILSNKEGLSLLKEFTQSATKIHTLLAPSLKFKNIYGIQPNPARDILLRRLRRLNPKIEILSIRNAIKELRIIKQAPELHAIKKAIEITEGGLSDVHAQIEDFNYEYEVRAVLHAGFQRRGAQLAFDSIVASGPHASLLHYEKSGGEVKNGHMLLIDTGAMVEFYAADITRMFQPRSGLSQRQEAVYDAVVRAKNYAGSIMKPGIKHRDYEQLVKDYIGKELVKLGLLKRPTKTGIHRYFPSMTSHHLGLDVHDIANYDEEFAVDMVLTIEPGIYIPEEGIGVRIEDDVVVTKSGIKVLSEKLYT